MNRVLLCALLCALSLLAADREYLVTNSPTDRQIFVQYNNTDCPFWGPALNTVSEVIKKEAGVGYGPSNTSSAGAFFEDYQGSQGTPWTLYTGLALPSTNVASNGAASLAAYTYSDSTQWSTGVHGECDHGPLNESETNTRMDGSTDNIGRFTCVGVNAEAQSNSNSGTLIGINSLVGSGSYGDGFHETGVKVSMNYPSGSGNNTSIDGDGVYVVAGSGTHNGGIVVDETQGAGMFQYAIETLSRNNPNNSWLMWNANLNDSQGAPGHIAFARGRATPIIESEINFDTLNNDGSMHDGYMGFSVRSGNQLVEAARFFKDEFILGTNKGGVFSTNYELEVAGSGACPACTVKIADQSNGGATGVLIQAGYSQAGFNLVEVKDRGNNTLDAIDSSGNLVIPGIRARTGTRFVCVDTNGRIFSSASPCSGT